MESRREARSVGRDVQREHGAAVEEAAGRFDRFAPLIAQLFPETAATGGHIRSSLVPVERLAASLGIERWSGRLFVKWDHDLPIAGSIKARGGIHAVLAIAEGVADAYGLIVIRRGILALA